MINNVNSGHLRAVETVRPGKAEHNSNAKPVDIASSPSVSGALAGAIQHMVQQGMPIDLQRVVEVRNAIADGQYPVDPDMIAEKIIEFDRPTSAAGQ